MNSHVVDTVAEFAWWTALGFWLLRSGLRQLSPRPAIYWPIHQIAGPGMFTACFLKVLAADTWPGRVAWSSFAAVYYILWMIDDYRDGDPRNRRGRRNRRLVGKVSRGRWGGDVGPIANPT